VSEESAGIFALKTYITAEAKNYYDNEVTAFHKLRRTPNIIEFYGSYVYGDSFNILLEFADKGDLERYFREETEPKSGKDIIKFWRSIFMLTKALAGIHEVEPRSSTNGPPIFEG
jgi:serine/threonine protein kinase